MRVCGLRTITIIMIIVKKIIIVTIMVMIIIIFGCDFNHVIRIVVHAKGLLYTYLYNIQ